MKDWLTRLRKVVQRWHAPKRPDRAVWVYCPHEGACCYTLDLLGTWLPPEQVPVWLLGSDLAWYWDSWEHVPKPPFKGSRKELLTKQTEGLLRQELTHLWDDPPWSFVFYGVSLKQLSYSSNRTQELDQIREQLDDWASRFIKTGHGDFEQATLEIVIEHIGDAAFGDHIFLGTSISNQVYRLFQQIGVDLGSPNRRICLPKPWWR